MIFKNTEKQKMSKELVSALDALEEEKGIKAEVLIAALEEALKKGVRKKL